MNKKLLVLIPEHLGRTSKDMGGEAAVTSLAELGVGFHIGAKLAGLEDELATRLRQFKRLGGRGVALAEEIDELKVLIFLVRRAGLSVVSRSLLD